jgi:hypothetical protein
MIVRPAQLRPIPAFLLPFTQSTIHIQTRSISQNLKTTRIPPKLPFCPDVKTFLTLIGRNLSKHADKIKTWRSLFNLRSEDLKKLGIEPPRTRRYLLRRLEQFRQGQYGVGGDLQHVENGAAEVRVLEVLAPGAKAATATLSPGMRKIVVNVASGSKVEAIPPKELVPVKGVHIKGANRVAGSNFLPLKGGGGAKIAVAEGLWEDRRGRKIDGGERRAAETRVSPSKFVIIHRLRDSQAKRRAEERKSR